MIAKYTTWIFFLTHRTHADCELRNICWSLGSCMDDCPLNSENIRVEASRMCCRWQAS